MWRFFLKNNHTTLLSDDCAASTVTKRLVLFGGGKMPDEGTDIFLSSVSRRPIVVIPWASKSQHESFEAINSTLKNRKKVSVECTPLYDMMRNGNGQDKFFSLIKQAAGIFIGGGDQVRLAEILLMPGVSESLITAHNRGIVFGGKSAGVACVSNPMISGKGDANRLMNSSLELVPGLGLLTGVLTDQHFLIRNRMQRLMTGLLLSDHGIGLGVDEDSAVVITNSCIVQAIGGAPAIVIVKHNDLDLQIIILNKGQSFDFCRCERTQMP
jgi:cyanophycinase